MNIPVSELKHEKYNDGYRIVYFYPDDRYSIGAFCKTIEGFMIEFCDEYPIMDNDDIPKFKSSDDLLSRYLDSSEDILAVAIYSINGTCIAKKEKKSKQK